MNPDAAAFSWHKAHAAGAALAFVFALVGLIGHIRFRRDWVMTRRPEDAA